MKEIGVGVVGCGYWGPNLIRNFARAEGARVVAVCDASRPRAEAARTLAPSAALYTDYAEMLADPAVNAVAVATPVGTHHALSLKAIEAGKHVIVEKPLATSSKAAYQIVEAALRRGLILMTGHTFLYSPAVRKIKELIDNGSIGEMLAVDSSRMNLGIFRGDVNVLWDLAPHDISILMYVLGATPADVCADGSGYMRPDVADVAYMDMRFATGVSAHVVVSWLSPVKLRRMVFVGRSGMVLYDDSQEQEKVKLYRGDSAAPSPEELLRDPGQLYTLGDLYSPALSRKEPLRIQADEFIRCIQTGDKPASDGEFGTAVVRVLEAADRSMQQQGLRTPVSAQDRVR